EVEGDPRGDGAGAGACCWGVPGATITTWRKSSWAVVPTRFTTDCDWWPGTDTLIRSLPWVFTVAPVVARLLTRLSRRPLATFISAGDGVECPLTGCAFSVTVVPPARSSPSPTRNRLCQFDG